MAKSCAFVDLGDVAAQQKNSARINLDEPDGGFEQSGLTAAGRAQDHPGLAGAHLK